jgi:tetratricopeptide (TPR) repeat protein
VTGRFLIEGKELKNISSPVHSRPDGSQGSRRFITSSPPHIRIIIICCDKVHYMKPGILILGMLLLVPVICTAGDTTGDALYALGIHAYEEQNYETAIDLFNQSVTAYDREGNTDGLRTAQSKLNRANWILFSMPLNRTEAQDTLAQSLPNLSQADRDQFLEPGRSIQMVSDGKVRYFDGIAKNAAYHNATIMQDRSRTQNHSAFFDEIYPLIIQNKSFEGAYGNPHTFTANSSLSIPREMLAKNGTLKVWIPLPVEIDSQKDIRILTLGPEKYVASEPVTTGDIGQVYFEIPLGEMKDPFVNLTTVYQFTTFERRFEIDPETIEPYDTGSELYQKYTASQPNIELTPALTTLAESIIGDEKNPYRKARLIYEYIITTYPYSNVPHAYLSVLKVPESTFLFETGFGDCGTQSMLFAALCRSVGIPARAAGGYQLIPGLDGTHFWAEFYLPGYGWIPVDVTIAESADWAFDKTDDERNRFKDYYFGSMDPYRYTIQNDVDIPFTPDTGDDFILTVVHQKPATVCTECRDDPEALGLGYFNGTFSE